MLDATNVRILFMSALTSAWLAGEPMCKLPEPEYERQESDPAWLAYAAQFHGHLGPWATAGTRLGMAGVREVGAKGYFDVEVTCEGPFVKPPKSCFLDGLQVGTGATLGKRNLRWVQKDEITVRVTNTRTGRRAEIRPTAKLVQLLGSFKPRVKAAEARQAEDADNHQAEHAVEALARKIATMPDKEILRVTKPGK